MEDPVRVEYLRQSAATLRKYKSLADRSLARASDAHFFEAPDDESNSMAVLVKHMAGNLVSRWTDLLSSDGEKPDRDRDSEFEITARDTRDSLMASWENGWTRAFHSLEALTPADLDRTIPIAGEPHSVVQAVNRHVTHAAYHVGQIVYIAKHYAADGWESLSIPRPRTASGRDSLASLRDQLAKALVWGDAHVAYDEAVRDFPPELRGVRAEGFPYSAWQLVEHLRIAQRDILDFCREEPYEELRWPEEYWPRSESPPAPDEWDASIDAFRADREALKQIARSPTVDLSAVVPHGADQRYLRQLLLVVDHGAYHVGQLVLLRRALGAWRPR